MDSAGNAVEQISGTHRVHKAMISTPDRTKVAHETRALEGVGCAVTGNVPALYVDDEIVVSNQSKNSVQINMNPLSRYLVAAAKHSF